MCFLQHQGTAAGALDVVTGNDAECRRDTRIAGFTQFFDHAVEPAGDLLEAVGADDAVQRQRSRHRDRSLFDVADVVAFALERQGFERLVFSDRENADDVADAFIDLVGMEVQRSELRAVRGHRRKVQPVSDVGQVQTTIATREHSGQEGDDRGDVLVHDLDRGYFRVFLVVQADRHVVVAGDHFVALERLERVFGALIGIGAADKQNNSGELALQEFFREGRSDDRTRTATTAGEHDVEVERTQALQDVLGAALDFRSIGRTQTTGTVNAFDDVAGRARSIGLEVRVARVDEAHRHIGEGISGLADVLHEAVLTDRNTSATAGVDHDAAFFGEGDRAGFLLFHRVSFRNLVGSNSKEMSP